MSQAKEIKEIVNGDETVNEIIDLTIERLEEWGVTDYQPFEIAYPVRSTIEYIKNTTNQLEVPEGLTFTAVDMICGDFLNDRLSAGNLPEGLQIQKAIKSMKVGDTTTTYEKSGVQGIELLIGSLTGRKGDVLSYRKLKW